MPTAEGCRARRRRLLDALGVGHPLLLADPLNLRYFANSSVDPFSYGADFGGFLVIEPDGRTKLVHDSRLPKTFAANARADELVAVPWYDGKSAGKGNRRTSLQKPLFDAGTEGRVHDALTDPLSCELWSAVTLMRRKKDADEVEALQKCMAVGKAGHDWARANVRAGMTELDVYNGVFTACSTAAGTPVIVYGDFAVSPGSAKRGGPPTSTVLKDGDTLILDFSAVIDGYRSDYTNTLVVGGRPTADQQRLFDLSLAAMKAGEATLRAGVTCQAVYDAVNRVFLDAGVGAIAHHAGHGLGLGHPEAPFFVAKSSETLVAGDVVTLEPGLYVDGVGGVRIEHNYLVTDEGYERLSDHTLSLV